MTENVSFNILCVAILIFAVAYSIARIELAVKRRREKRQAKAQDSGFVNGFTGTPIEQEPSFALFRTVGLQDKCPDCTGDGGFYQGPSGGISTNIYCCNPECRSAFNLAYFSSKAGTCERIGKQPIDRYPISEEEKARIRSKEATAKAINSMEAR